LALSQPALLSACSNKSFSNASAPILVTIPGPPLFQTHNVQALMEAAYAPFDASLLGQPGAAKALKAAHDAASGAAYETAWDAVVKTAVDNQNPVQTPPCHSQQP